MALGKEFAECVALFAECYSHSVNTQYPVVDLTQAAAERGFCLGLGLATGYFLRPLPGGAKVQRANCLAYFLRMNCLTN